MDIKEVFVNFNYEDHCGVVKCDCGYYHKYETGVMPKGFCPGCGGKIIGYKAQNVPLEEVPMGYRATLVGEYEKYGEWYYGNKDHWSEVFSYKRAIYNENKPEMFEDYIVEVFEGWCYVNDYTPIYCHINDKDVFMGYESSDLSMHHMLKKDFAAIIAEEIARVKQKQSAPKEKAKIIITSDNKDILYDGEADDEGYFDGKSIIKAIRDDLCPYRVDEEHFDKVVKIINFSGYKRFKEKGQLTFDQICDFVNVIEVEFGTDPFDAEIYK